MGATEMSYCRWSSDNWKCDLYCYQHFNGTWTTHVAKNKVIGVVPEELDITSVSIEEWAKAHRAAMHFLETAERRPIGLRYDGKTFHDPTLEEFRDRLLHLRAEGYHFPNYVLAGIDEEIAENHLLLLAPKE
jgi:hypothetical protein